MLPLHWNSQVVPECFPSDVVADGEFYRLSFRVLIGPARVCGRQSAPDISIAGRGGEPLNEQA